MAITAALVKQLRERTGAGMMDCKKALSETGGDIEAAEVLMRKKGKAKAGKKADRVAAEGMVAIARDGARAAIVEINSETDFVARGEAFREFAGRVAQVALQKGADGAETLLGLPFDGHVTVEEARQELTAKIGENIQVRRAALVESAGVLGHYVHSNDKIGVLVALDGGDEALAVDLAMHVAWSNPMCLTADEVPADVIAREREILTEQALNEGKPREIVDKMVEGRLRKYLAEITLLGQVFVKDSKTTVGKLLDQAGASVAASVRFEVGEGVEKKQDDFAAEVMAQVRGEE